MTGVRVKTALVLAVSLMVGTLVAWLVFVIGFNMPRGRSFAYASLAPAALAVGSAYALAKHHPRQWLLVALGLALPTVGLSALMAALLLNEGRPAFDWLAAAGIAVVTCLAAAAAGRR